VLKNKCLPLFFVVSVETAKDTWEKLRQCFLNALNWRRNKKRGDGAKKKKLFLGGSTWKCLFFCLHLTQKYSEQHTERRESGRHTN